MPTVPLHRYEMNVEIPATDVAVVLDALDGEQLTIRDLLGGDELRRQITDQRIAFDRTLPSPAVALEKDLAALSTYLADPIFAREFHREPDASGSKMSGALLLARRGEAHRVSLTVGWDEASKTVVERGIDMEDAHRRWDALPPWVRTFVTSHGTPAART